MVMLYNIRCWFCPPTHPGRVVGLLNTTDPTSVSLDETKGDQILSITNDMLLLLSSQTPTIQKLLHSCQYNHLKTLDV